MNRQEWQVVTIISSIVSLRLLGIFLVLPIFSTYAVRYPHATGPLAGLAFGIYALVQAILQLPMGYASDHWGRKPVLALGLLLFTAGSFLCARAISIEGLIAARALQGAGAIGAVALAALGDLTRPNFRARAFTIMGISVGMAFTLGIIAGPILAGHLGFPHLFDFLAALGAAAFLITMTIFPGAAPRVPLKEKPKIRAILRLHSIRKIIAAAFALSFILNAFLFVYPLDWKRAGVPPEQLWKVYLIIFLPAAIIVFPLVRIAEIRRILRLPVLVGWILLSASMILYFLTRHAAIGRYFAGALFFLGYTLFQPLLPAFLTQHIGRNARGTATGVYNLSGFLGASFGGILGGVLYHYHPAAPVGVAALLTVLWIIVGLPSPPDPLTIART